MASYRRRLMALVFIVSAFSFLPREGRACSICQPGDPLYSSDGTSAQPEGAFRFYVENRHTWKSSAALPHGHEEGEDEEASNPPDRERSYDRDLTLWASWTPLSRFSLSVSVPYRWITLDEEPVDEPSSRVRNRGFGDVALYGTAVLWRDFEHAATAWIEARAMLKTPTGASEKSFRGELDPHIQVGTGSWDCGLGLAGAKRIEQGTIYASAFYRVNQQGSLEYTYGAALLANVVFASHAHAIEPLGGIFVRPGAELNFRYAGKDVEDGSLYDSSGGSIVYLTPFVEIPITTNPEARAPWLRIAVRVPLGDGGLHGHQHEGFVILAGAGLPF